MLISFLALTAALTGSVSATAPATSAQEAAPSSDRFEGRPEARIAFTRSIRNFRVERESGDDILYVEANAREWYRGELSCFGFGDARDAHALVPQDRGFGLDRLSRVKLIGLGRHSSTDCHLQSLVKLTPEEAVDLKLVRAPKS